MNDVKGARVIHLVNIQEEFRLQLHVLVLKIGTAYIARFLPWALKVCQCCICVCMRDRIDFRESGRADLPGSCITRGRQVAHFRPAETIVPTGARLCACRGPPCYTTRSYMGQNGTERYGMRQKQNTPIVSAHTHDRRPFSGTVTTMSSVLRLLQICKREPCFSFVDL